MLRPVVGARGPVPHDNIVAHPALGFLRVLSNPKLAAL